MIHLNTKYIMFVLNIPVFICMLFVQITTKYMYSNFRHFPGGYSFGAFSGGGDFLGAVSHMVTIRPWQLRAPAHNVVMKDDN